MASLELAIARGALDIAHGFYVGVANWFGRLEERIYDRLGIMLGRNDLTELVGITENSRLAAESMWSGNVNEIEIPYADPPYMGSVNGGQFDKYQVKIINHAASDDGRGKVKSAVYLEFPDIPSKVGIEEYIRRFWEELRGRGHDTTGLDWINPGSMRNIPIMLVKRKHCP